MAESIKPKSVIGSRADLEMDKFWLEYQVKLQAVKPRQKDSAVDKYAPSIIFWAAFFISATISIGAILFLIKLLWN